MKKYTAPEARTELLHTSDVITLSVIDSLFDWKDGFDISNLDEWTKF